MLLLLGLLLMAQEGFSSGWVKDEGKFYSKLDNSESSEREFDHGGYRFEQSEQTTAVYVEYGPQPSSSLTMPLSVYGAVKTIRREDPVVKDHFTARGFTDTDVTAKFKVAQLPWDGGNKGTFYFAATAGTTLPTTKKNSPGATKTSRLRKCRLTADF